MHKNPASFSVSMSVFLFADLGGSASGEEGEERSWEARSRRSKISPSKAALSMSHI
jgi:hypothetical protein